MGKTSDVGTFTFSRFRFRAARTSFVCDADVMAIAHRVAPIFSVRDLDAALSFYERLGFAVRRYSGGGYGFAHRDAVEIHLGVPSGDHHPGSAYLFVDDADRLAENWRAAGVEVHTPQDTEWGQHEGALVDPDGNVIRFGSPMR